MNREQSLPLVRVGAAVRSAPAGRATLVQISPALTNLVRLSGDLGAATGLAVEPRSFDGYAELLGAIEAGEIELAWLPPIPALRAIRAGAMAPLALPVRAGSTSFGSALFAREDSRVRNLVDLAAVRAAWVDEQSAAGYVVIRAALRARGIDLRAAFGQELFFGSHDAVVEAVLSGDADVGATHVQFAPDGAGLSRPGWGARRVRVVALAGPIPGDLLACATHVPAPVRAAVAQALVGGGAEAAARLLLEAEALVPARPEHAEALGALAAHLEAEEASCSTLPPPGS